MIIVIDYDAGNKASVRNALGRMNVSYEFTADPKVISRADKVILPGVGDAAKVMESIRQKELADVITDLRCPVLGICVGMQIMCRESEENNAQCLGIFDSHVRRFDPINQDKVPHMGWNTLSNMESRLFKDLTEGEYVYYVHSYRADLCPDTIATTFYCGSLFSAALKYENFYGTQFHPEKSGSTGEKILRNFLEL